MPGVYAYEGPSGWEWEAGPASGLSGDEVAARGHAAQRLWSGEAQRAVVRMVLIVTGGPALDGHYQPVAGTRVEGRRYGEGIQWLRANAPGSGG
jgi:hypothetical protein